MSDNQELIDALVKYRDERDLAQFHDSKNLATANVSAAAELNELLLWKTNKENEQVARERNDAMVLASDKVGCCLSDQQRPGTELLRTE